MDANRRNLMKGMLTGGTLLALGIPPGALASAPAGKARLCGLLLENSLAHAGFAAGVRAAHAAFSRAGEAGVHDGVLKVVKLRRGLLNDYEIVVGLLERSHDTRWIAVMDDGSAAVFMELARNADARLVLLGSHASSGGVPRLDVSNDIPELRHVWAAAAPEQSAGNILASQLVANQESFSIVENFFSASPSKRTQLSEPTANRFVPGFQTWRLEGVDAIHLHCSGLSPSAGCKLLGWDGDGGGRWTPVSRQDSGRETVAEIWQPPRSVDWVESVGYAVMAAALGSGTFQESCSSRAFVHRPGDGVRAKSTGSVEKFTSFVIET